MQILLILSIALTVVALVQGIRAEVYKKRWQYERDINEINNKFIDEVLSKSIKAYIEEHEPKQGGANGKF